MSIRSAINRLPVDRFLLMMIATIALAAFLPARGQVAEAFDWVVFAAIALLFFLYGARISPQAVWAGLLHWRLQGLVFLSTFALFPLIGLVASPIADAVLPAELAFGILFVTLLPSTVQSSIAFTSIAGGNVPAALTSASVSNLLGVLVTPALVLLLAHAQGGGFSFDAITKIAVQILVPFALGQLFRPLIGGWLGRHKKLTQVVDRGSILLVVYAAFSEGMVAGVWSQLGLGDLATVVAFDVVILAIVLAFTTAAARLFGFTKPDEIAIVFCGSKKSMATGIPMAGILFPGHALALIVLPLMLFHQIQLFACATLAQRYSRQTAAVPETTAAEAMNKEQAAVGLKV
ncbi:bile acid:sodium symporter family protein [Aureimonas jatrophae]|uniref:Solute carrier family 10 (Sodium/bile acid cotransporter), member 7 n=1 Tax=Aureimonas jatrophae TaxID=1166073 RepID=A0A1H0BZC1_9HYPH|nr:bile acid:sodium symporter family protein [Aureimonas jatrophae]MBB3948996.1 sodium/bile acid cotransporter 7 [Aureimonas jatrophae]SDN50915.1 solute carrier family 10 (sodium/bile acid cotransporter), member 7 [Aureimonas jatrophae]